MAAHQASPSLGFSRQEHWSGLPFPSPMPESEVAQSCPTLSNPMDCSPPGSPVHGIFQARVLEWGAIAFSAYRVWRSLNKIILLQQCLTWLKCLISSNCFFQVIQVRNKQTKYFYVVHLKRNKNHCKLFCGIL